MLMILLTALFAVLYGLAWHVETAKNRNLKRRSNP